IIDGNAWLNVRIAVYAAGDVNHTGPQIATYNTMQEMVPLMLNGTYSVSQLQAVRELKFADGADFDTARFQSGLFGLGADGVAGTAEHQPYTFKVDGVDVTLAQLRATGLGHVITVTDTVGNDGVDRVMNVERLQFADQSIVLGGVNHQPAGTMALSGA